MKGSCSYQRPSLQLYSASPPLLPSLGFPPAVIPFLLCHQFSLSTKQSHQHTEPSLTSRCILRHCPISHLCFTGEFLQWADYSYSLHFSHSLLSPFLLGFCSHHSWLLLLGSLVIVTFVKSSGPFSPSYLTSQQHSSGLNQDFNLSQSKCYFSSSFALSQSHLLIPSLFNPEMLEHLRALSWILFRPLSTHTLYSSPWPQIPSMWQWHISVILA